MKRCVVHPRHQTRIPLEKAKPTWCDRIGCISELHDALSNQTSDLFQYLPECGAPGSLQVPTIPGYSGFMRGARGCGSCQLR